MLITVKAAKLESQRLVKNAKKALVLFKMVDVFVHKIKFYKMENALIKYNVVLNIKIGFVSRLMTGLICLMESVFVTYLSRKLMETGNVLNALNLVANNAVARTNAVNVQILKQLSSMGNANVLKE